MADTTKLYNIISGLYDANSNIFTRLSGHEDDSMMHITAAESSYTSGDLGRVVRKDDALFLVREVIGSEEAWNEKDPSKPSFEVGNSLMSPSLSDDYPVFGTYYQQKEQINDTNVFKNSNGYYIALFKKVTTGGNGSYKYALFTALQYFSLKTNNGIINTNDVDSSILAELSDNVIEYELPVGVTLNSGGDVYIMYTSGNNASTQTSTQTTTSSYEESAIINDDMFSDLAGISNNLISKM